MACGAYTPVYSVEKMLADRPTKDFRMPARTANGRVASRSALDTERRDAVTEQMVMLSCKRRHKDARHGGCVLMPGAR